MNITHPFLEFLQYLPGQKEVALVVSHDPRELGSYADLLEEQGFVPAHSVIELLRSVESGTDSYILADGLVQGEPKDLYDLVAQYPTGQVQIWSNEDKRMVTASPSYKGAPPVLVTNAQNLALLGTQGFDIRQHSGLAYQTT